jgi:NAD(P)-dependent dehydrogenase (short-subunit alcohol dehydrogenase family)
MDGAVLNKGTRILIAGATSDMAGPLVARLLEQPVKVGLHGYRSLDRLAEWESAGLTAERKVFQADLSSGAAAERLVQSYLEWSGGIDVLVQFTGDITEVCSWEDICPEAWERDITVNCSVPFFLAREASKAMEHGGRIVLMSTASASRGGGARSFAYGVAKAGVEAVVKGLARFCGPRNILVNAVSPGFIKTRFQTVRAGKTPEQMTARTGCIPLGRAGEVEDVAGLIYYLISPANNYTTGECIAVSGGDFI